MERWSKIKIGNDLFFVKFDQKSLETGESFTFWLSDFKTLWSESVNSKDNLLQRLADENPTLEISDDISDQFLHALNTIGLAHVKTDIKPGDEEIKFRFKLSLDGGISPQFHWLLKKCEPHDFYDHVTKSLLYQICELSQLIDMVTKKDEEIRQYKLEGAKPLERKRFITDVFNADVFKSKSQIFDCAIDDFQSIIGPLAKKVDEHEKKEEVISPKKPIFTSNRGAVNRLLFRNQPLVKPGDVKYMESDDEEDESTSTSEAEIKPEDEIKVENEASEPVAEAPASAPVRVATMPIPIPKKRLRRNFNI